jgi:hypothetical protein
MYRLPLKFSDVSCKPTIILIPLVYAEFCLICLERQIYELNLERFV